MSLTPRPVFERPGLKQRSPAVASERYFDLKSKVHRRLLESLNTETLKLISKERLRGEIGRAVEQLLDRKSTRLNSSHIQKSRMPSSA